MQARPGSIMERFLVLDEQGSELALEQMPGRRLFKGERPQPLLVRNIVRATGEERWLIVRSSPVTDPESGRVLFAVNVFENITEVKRAQLAESFMAEASRVLASSMDYAETLQRIARLAVPQIADGARSTSSTSAARSNAWPSTIAIRRCSRWRNGWTADIARRPRTLRACRRSSAAGAHACTRT